MSSTHSDTPESELRRSGRERKEPDRYSPTEQLRRTVSAPKPAAVPGNSVPFENPVFESDVLNPALTSPVRPRLVDMDSKFNPYGIVKPPTFEGGAGTSVYALQFLSELRIISPLLVMTTFPIL